MIDIATLRAMRKAGVPAVVILDVVEAELEAEGIRVQARRARDALRQRRKRHADSAESHGVTRTRDDSDSLTFLTESVSKQEESKKERKSPRARKSLLPDSWLPNLKHYAKGSHEYVDQKADDMRNWAKSKAIMRADWDACFHGFLKPRGAGNGTTNRQSPSERAYGLANKIREVELTESLRRSPDIFGNDRPRR